jgi:hypothetical protein
MIGIGGEGDLGSFITDRVMPLVAPHLRGWLSHLGLSWASARLWSWPYAWQEFWRRRGEEGGSRTCRSDGVGRTEDAESKREIGRDTFPCCRIGRLSRFLPLTGE